MQGWARSKPTQWSQVPNGGSLTRTCILLVFISWDTDNSSCRVTLLRFRNQPNSLLWGTRFLNPVSSSFLLIRWNLLPEWIFFFCFQVGRDGNPVLHWFLSPRSLAFTFSRWFTLAHLAIISSLHHSGAPRSWSCTQSSFEDHFFSASTTIKDSWL